MSHREDCLAATRISNAHQRTQSHGVTLTVYEKVEGRPSDAVILRTLVPRLFLVKHGHKAFDMAEEFIRDHYQL